MRLRHASRGSPVPRCVKTDAFNEIRASGLSTGLTLGAARDHRGMIPHMKVYSGVRTVAGVLVSATAIVAMSGCGQGTVTGTDSKEAAPTISTWHSATLQDAKRTFQEDFQKLAQTDCSTDCGSQLSAVFNSGLLLKDLMTKSGAPKITYAEPIRLFGELEEGFSAAAGLSGQARLHPMLGPARKLNDWLNAHPFE